MDLETLNLLFFAVMAMPLVLVVTQAPRVRGNPLVTALAVCYAVFVVDEFTLMRVGEEYLYYHVLVGGILLSAVTGISCILEAGEDAPRPRFGPYYAVLALLLIGLSTYLYTAPDSLGSIVALAAAGVLVINGVLLIRTIEDNAAPYLGIIALWTARHFGMQQQWAVVNLLFTGGFYTAVSLYVAVRVLRVNRRIIEEKAFELNARETVVNMLYDISSSEQSISSLDFTLVRVLEAIIDALSVEGAAVYIKEGQEGEVPQFRFANSSGVFWTMQLHGEHGGGKTTFVSADLRRECYKAGDGLVGIVGKIGESMELDRGHDRVEMRNVGINPHNIRNILAVPLKIKENTLGVLVVQNRKNKTSFSSDDTRLLEALTEQAAISINNVRMYEELARTHRIRQEMSIATDIQKQLLPKTVPTSQHLSVHPFIRPAKEVGGDYYDFIECDERHHAIVIGDVSGKGLPAGMIMVIARTTLQIVARGENNTSEVLTHFSREMYPRMRRGQFMTLNYLIWDDDTRELRYSAAGHEHILWYRNERGKSERIKAGGVAVGLLEDPSEYVSESCLATQPGDLVVLYTDGMTEARNAVEEMYTLNRLQDSLDRHASLHDATKVSEAIMADIMEFAGDADQYDDMTLLVATVT